jgi:glycosyltransferase involved in cell wall biosynthesis
MTPELMRVAVLVPCLDEARTVAAVVQDAKTAIPDAHVVVGDNESTDGTADIARVSGAVVVGVSERGKGRVMTRLFADVEADIYVMVDGDGTYDLATLADDVRRVTDSGVDMVVGARSKAGSGKEFRAGHRWGNAALTWIFRRLFELPLTDTLSGYRVMSRRFVKSFPIASDGFEIETDLNVHAATLRCAVLEVPVAYRERPEGSESKLQTYSDGWRILRRNLALYKEARPRQAFGILAAPWLIATAILVGIPVLEFFNTGLVLRFPSLIAGVGSFVVGVLLLQTGLIVARTAALRRESIQLAFLGYPSPRRWL